MRSLCLLLLLASTSSAADRGVRVTAPEKLFPPMKALVIVKAGEPGPGLAKHQPIASIDRYKETLKFSTEGPYDVWWQPKTGQPVRVLANLTLKDGEEREIKLADLLGIVTFRGDEQPRASLVTIAPQDDPGPGEKGHRAIQTAHEFRVDMVVPDGFYSLWITPENNGRPRKIIDRFRAQAGKSVQLD